MACLAEGKSLSFTASEVGSLSCPTRTLLLLYIYIYIYAPAVFVLHTCTFADSPKSDPSRSRIEGLLQYWLFRPVDFIITPSN